MDVKPDHGGLLAYEGIRVSEGRVGKALKLINPEYHQSRLSRAHQHLNPTPYRAKYFGHAQVAC